MLTPRQAEIAQLVAKGFSAKAIARRKGIAVQTVHNHIQAAAARVPGDGTPRFKLIIFSLTRDAEQDAA
jgi:DNA-binding NarL/FixJ family response regulator